jgi:hypothetical protein
VRTPTTILTAVLSTAALAFLLSPSGCKRAEHAVEAPAAAFAATEHRAQLSSAQQQLSLIPPPSKSLYMAVHSLTDWENPYLTVQPDHLTLHVLLADANPSNFGAGGVLRPTAARRQQVDVRLEDLPAALNAVPATSWPYGRVVAVEEAHNTPASIRPQVRRNLESAMQSLTDLGVVVDDRSESGQLQQSH